MRGMTNSIQDTARESARKNDGRFGEQMHSGPDVSIPVPAFSDTELDEAASAAVATALWLSSDVDDAQSEGRSIDASEEVHEHYRREIADFIGAYPDLIQEARDSGYTSSDGTGFTGQFGHDFVLTRGREGAGFWDSESLKADGLGKRLTDAVQARGEDDDLIYIPDDSDTAELEFGEHIESQTELARASLASIIAAASVTEETDSVAAHTATQVLTDAGLLRRLSYTDARWLNDRKAGTSA